MQRLLNQLCAEAPFGLVVLNDRGFIVRANQTILQWAGADADQVLHRSWADVFPKAGFIGERSSSDRVSSTPGTPQTEEPLRGGPAGTGAVEPMALAPGLIHSSVDRYLRLPMTSDHEGTATLLLFFGSTQADALCCCFAWTVQQWQVLDREQQRLAKKLERANSHLLRSEKLAGIGQLAAGVAHEINNPIGYVFSNLKTLAGYMQDMLRIIDAVDKLEHIDDIRSLKRTLEYDYIRGDVEALIEESEEGIERVKKIISALKDFSHIADDGYRKADIHRGIETTLNVINNELKYKAQLVKDYGSLPLVECNISQINQVLMNLLLNAAQAIQGSGVITIRTRHEDPVVWIEISDTGEGMSPDVASRVFEPFFTTKPVGQGTGLGLALSYSIVQKHHGDIDVTSEPGRGTTFRVTLPVQNSAASFKGQHHVESSH